MGKMIHTDKVREPEFLEIKLLDQENDLHGIQRLRLSALLMQRDAAIVEYYDHVKQVGDLRNVDPYTDDHDTGTDEQREQWKHAARQRILWYRVSVYNGEFLRRIYAGKQAALDLLAQIQTLVVDQVAADGARPPTKEELEKEKLDAEQPPRT